MKKFLLSILALCSLHANADTPPIVYKFTAPLSKSSNNTVSIPQATSSVDGYLLSTDWSTFNNKQNGITAGTTLQYWRGDKSFQTLDTSVVPENGNLYFTNARVRSAVTATAPIVFNSSTGVFTCNAASGSQAGCLSSTDWSTFNSKQAALTPGTISTSTTGVSVGSGTSSTVGPNVTVNVQTASGSQPGLLSAADWTTFNGKQAALTIGDLTAAGTDGLVVTSGAGSVIGSGTSLAQHVSDSTHNGYLSSTDWSLFNGKESVLTFTSPLLRSTNTITCQTASGSLAGCLSSADWTTFNGKQASGNYITALTGDVTASGPGSAAATLANTAVTPGSYTLSSITVDSKGRITSASNGSGSAPSLTSTFVGFGSGSNLLTGAATFTWDANRFHLDGGNAGASYANFTAGTQSGTSSTDGGYIGLEAGNNGFLMWQQETAANLYLKFGTQYRFDMNSTRTILKSPDDNYSLTVNNTGLSFADSGLSAVPPVYFSAALGLGYSNFTTNVSQSAVATGVIYYDVSGAARTYTLLTAGATGANGRYTTVEKTDASNNKVTVAGTIDGITGRTLNARGDTFIIHGDGTDLHSNVDNRAPCIWTKTANYTVVADCRETTILCDATSGAVTITGYATVGHPGWKIKMKKIDSSVNACTFDPNSSENVDNATTDVVSIQYAAREYDSDGAAWWIF